MSKKLTFNLQSVRVVELNGEGTGPETVYEGAELAAIVGPAAAGLEAIEKALNAAGVDLALGDRETKETP
jgi:hypothetical protein